MIHLDTFAELCRQRHTLGLYCIACERWGSADLPRLIARGYGQRAVIAARFRCRDCGELVQKQVRPPTPPVQAATPYIGGEDGQGS